MGSYTEIYVNVDLISETPDEIIETLRAICNNDRYSPYLENKPRRWFLLFVNGSYYTPLTSCAQLTKDKVGGHYSLLGKGDIKNYEGEIGQFFDFIKPWCVKSCSFIGYHRYEEDKEPTLVYLEQ